MMKSYFNVTKLRARSEAVLYPRRPRLAALTSMRLFQRPEARRLGYGTFAVICIMSLCTGPSFAVQAANDAKNMANVAYRAVPSDFEKLVAAEPDAWDFNFRPYGRTSDLVSDPSVIRGAISGESVEGHPTAVRTVWDENGFTLLVFCSDTAVAKSLEEGRQLPLPGLEIYFTPSDTDNREPAFYWQFYSDANKFAQFDWPVNDRTWRLLKPYTTVETHPLPNGYVFRLSIAWEGLWDKLPFLSEKQDNLWRLQVIRWIDGGLTWGGEVHGPMRAGYLRWPAFTPAQRTSVLRRMLEKGWADYKRTTRKAAYNASPGNWNAPRVRTEPWYVAEVEANGPRSYINYAEDPAFRPVLEQLIAEADALGKDIAAFEKMDAAEQVAFYRRAAAKLFNFRYDVESAYANHVKAKLVK